MVTPAGSECRCYYEDFARGASVQECRAAKAPGPAMWTPSVCPQCPVPAITASNGSPELELRLSISQNKLRRKARVTVEAWCRSHGPVIVDPHVGCPECNAAADELLRDLFG